GFWWMSRRQAMAFCSTRSTAAAMAESRVVAALGASLTGVSMGMSQGAGGTEMVRRPAEPALNRGIRHHSRDPKDRPRLSAVAIPFTTRPEIRGTFGVVASTHWIDTE